MFEKLRTVDSRWFMLETVRFSRYGDASVSRWASQWIIAGDTLILQQDVRISQQVDMTRIVSIKRRRARSIRHSFSRQPIEPSCRHHRFHWNALHCTRMIWAISSEIRLEIKRPPCSSSRRSTRNSWSIRCAPRQVQWHSIPKSMINTSRDAASNGSSPLLTYRRRHHSLRSSNRVLVQKWRSLFKATKHNM